MSVCFLSLSENDDDERADAIWESIRRAAQGEENDVLIALESMYQ